ncbi:hypothetical protein JIG36_23550 [Actinoplanes sp. LDG1-06]|uniref:Uncharacterized protein n=1 Tax=Paractinoplanes ovalisporus TaxID=2810368 RepID=A0ABS2AFE3_9ACTN|nr:hypothetical protein [Actinoplanes ovalisporus]MBM2618536.1 hypothetical protein [Actinoplanes ovalisporus]
MLENLKDRTGAWTAELGEPDASGPVDFSVSCIGGGRLSYAYAEAAGTTACDGSILHNREEQAAAGPVAVRIEAAGGQRWSMLMVRGMRLSD